MEDRRRLERKGGVAFSSVTDPVRVDLDREPRANIVDQFVEADRTQIGRTDSAPVVHACEPEFTALRNLI